MSHEQELLGECTKSLEATNIQQPDSEQPGEAGYMGLPVELRLHIYRFVPGPIELVKKDRYLGHATAPRTSKAVLVTLAISKQVRAEAKAFIYQKMECGRRFEGIPSTRLNNPFWCAEVTVRLEASLSRQTSATDMRKELPVVVFGLRSCSTAA